MTATTKTIADVLAMPWGGDRNMALWDLLGGMAAAKLRGVMIAMVTERDVQIRCRDRAAWEYVRDQLGGDMSGFRSQTERSGQWLMTRAVKAS